MSGDEHEYRVGLAGIDLRQARCERAICLMSGTSSWRGLPGGHALPRKHDKTCGRRTRAGCSAKGIWPDPSSHGSSRRARKTRATRARRLQHQTVAEPARIPSARSPTVIAAKVSASRSSRRQGLATVTSRRPDDSAIAVNVSAMDDEQRTEDGVVVPRDQRQAGPIDRCGSRAGGKHAVPCVVEPALTATDTRLSQTRC